MEVPSPETFFSIRETPLPLAGRTGQSLIKTITIAAPDRIRQTGAMEDIFVEMFRCVKRDAEKLRHQRAASRQTDSHDRCFNTPRRNRNQSQTAPASVPRTSPAPPP